MNSSTPVLFRLVKYARALKRFSAFALLALSNLFFALPTLAQTTTADAPSYAGFWVKPSESGWGLNLQHQGDSIFAAWYTYAADGSPTWFTMSCKLIGNQCKENIYTVTGKPLSQGLTNIGANVVSAGTGSFTFNSTSNLSFTYTAQGKTKTVSDVTKFNFARVDLVPVCTQTNASRLSSANYTDTWWGGAEASGWGLSLSHQGDNIFVAMYTYSDDTKPAWATGLVTKVAGTAATYKGDFSAPRSGTPFFDINGANATSFPLPKTGTFTLTFISGEAATLDYDLAVAGATTSSKGRVALSRLAVATGATTSCGVAPRTPMTGPSKMAVVTGNDRIENVLAKLGYAEIDDRPPRNGLIKLGTQKFDLYFGGGGDEGAGGYQSVTSLFGDQYVAPLSARDGIPDIFKYDIVFFANNTNDSSMLVQADRAVLRDYVEKGGRIFVIGRPNNYIRQAFPEFINFYSTNNAPIGSVANYYDPGIYGYKVNVSSFDSAMVSWLRAAKCFAGIDFPAPCVENNDTINLYNRSPFPIINSVLAGVKVWASGDIGVYEDRDGVYSYRNKPFIVSVNVGLGKITYVPWNIFDGSANSFSPGERMFEYLVFVSP